ncbi:hypothetical protein LJC36_02245 [Desulfovibrio sp. OttesenSCG-928-C14]|nr:hypothetical protein [Desulfovibrio sp. OttesenSCG-928-C14]
MAAKVPPYRPCKKTVTSTFYSGNTVKSQDFSIKKPTAPSLDKEPFYPAQVMGNPGSLPKQPSGVLYKSFRIGNW